MWDATPSAYEIRCPLSGNHISKKVTIGYFRRDVEEMQGGSLLDKRLGTGPASLPPASGESIGTVTVQ
ncbi:MAG: hypothetical protein WA609_07615 [Terriglobales bacterium]